MAIVSWLIPTVLVVLVAAAAAELLSRWWIRHRSRYYVLPPGWRLRLRPDPDVFPQLESLVRFEVNSHGERGPELTRTGGRLYRVLVVGGSQPEGYLLDQDTTWPGALYRMLQRPEHLRAVHADRVHVGSIARSGVGSEGLNLILERILPQYPRLDTIIILVGASDVLRWLEVGAPPAPPPPVRPSEVFRCDRENPFGWRPRDFALVEIGRRLHRRWGRPVEVNERACRWIDRARAMRAAATTVRTAMPDPTPMLDHFDRHLRRAIARAQAHADRVLVVRQPWFANPSPSDLALMWHGGAGQAWRENVTTFFSTEVLASLMLCLDTKASEIARDLGVEQLDLMPVLPGSSATYYDFFHATPAGARIIAAAIAATLLRRPMLMPALHGTALESPLFDIELHQKVS